MNIKKILATSLSVVALSSLPIVANAQNMPQANKNVVVAENEGEVNFSDLSPNHWAYKAVKKVVEEYGILGGFPDGTFKGSRNLSRYEAATIVVKLVEYMDQASAKGTNASSANKAIVDKLKKEFMSEIDVVKADMKKLETKQEELQQGVDTLSGSVDAIKAALPKVKTSGEVTVREQVVTRELSTSKLLVNAPQVRGRLGFTGSSENMEMGLGLVTGSDLTNKFVSLGSENMGVSLDRLYVALKPQLGPVGFDLRLGRELNQFFKTSELVFDNDLVFDGGTLKIQFGDADNNLSLLGAATVSNDEATVKSLNLTTFGMNSFGGGAALNLANDTVKFMLAGNYLSLGGNASLLSSAGLVNARTVSADAKTSTLTSKFNLATGSLLFSLFPKAYFPITLKGDVSYNLGLDSTVKTTYASQFPGIGFVAGLELGKLEDAGNVMIAYNFKNIGVDSVFAPFMEDQMSAFGVSATGSNFSALAHEVKLGVQLAPSTSLIVTGQLSNPIGKDKADTSLGLVTGRAYLRQSF